MGGKKCESVKPHPFGFKKANLPIKKFYNISNYMGKKEGPVRTPGRNQN